MRFAEGCWRQCPITATIFDEKQTMTDDELNEIFRAIRHKRALSWKTIEKLAMEVRELRKPKETKSTPPAAKPSLHWNSYADVPMLNGPLSEYMDRVARDIIRQRESKLIGDFWVGVPMTNNVDPAKPQTMGGARLIEPKGKTG